MELAIPEIAFGLDISAFGLDDHIAVLDGPCRGRTVLAAPLREVFAVEQYLGIGWCQMCIRDRNNCTPMITAVIAMKNSGWSVTPRIGSAWACL